MSNEDGLAAPFDDDVFAEGDCRKVDFDFSLSEHIGGCCHVDEEIWDCDVSGALATGLALPSLWNVVQSLRIGWQLRQHTYLTLNCSLRTSRTQQAHGANHKVLEYPVTRPISLAHIVAEIRDLRSRWRIFVTSAER